MVLRIHPCDAAVDEPRLAKGVEWIGTPREELPHWRHGGFTAWKAPVLNEKTATVLYVGKYVDDTMTAEAWLFIRPFTLGQIDGFEAYTLFTEPYAREKGYASFLLKAALAEFEPLISDRKGMTEGAFCLWTRPAAPWQCELVDKRTGSILPAASIPAEFKTGAAGEDTHLLLRLASKATMPDVGSRSADR
ncbi:hypothetical protein FHW69_002816 [Luteibacter sp. Sphag1AF]|uniref:hypothetical protein n=1 Tax=Luteibacter sp. Sphag1AF TaxID=2587031 RepID=UPI001611E665|nr:hypothetical protein [Luteibacter sp. Sphag1AF]MBB3228181.1 hypothetical protein [Luteibacter sp. Sphag1AF]